VNPIPIHWAFNCRGNWDHGMMMLAAEGRLVPNQGQRFIETPNHEPGTVVCIQGAYCMRPEVFSFMRKLRRCLVVVLSDEEGKFEMGMVDGSNKVWMQYGRPHKHTDADRWVLTGYPVKLPEMMSEYRASAEQLPTLRWSFVGQLQNDTRKIMAVVASGVPDGLWKQTIGFGGVNGDGMSYGEYVQTMLRSDYVLCPPGNVVADSFRFAEALECGKVPVVMPRGEQEGIYHNYWTRVFNCWKGMLPFPVLESWSELPALLTEPPSFGVRESCREFWQAYKEDLLFSIERTVERLRA
jgi:hypothetical protein